MLVRYWLASLALLAAAPAFAARPQIQWNTEYDFSAIKTFQWRTPPGDSLARSDPFLHSHIVNAIEYQLSANGLTEVPANPDVFVTYTASSQRDVRLESESFGYSFGGYGLGRWGMYGYRVSGPVGPVSTTTRVIEIERGTLVVDIVDASNNELVWRGTASDITVTDSTPKMQRNIDKAVSAMAKQAKRLMGRE